MLLPSRIIDLGRGSEGRNVRCIELTLSLREDPNRQCYGVAMFDDGIKKLFDGPSELDSIWAQHPGYEVQFDLRGEPRELRVNPTDESDPAKGMRGTSFGTFFHDAALLLQSSRAQGREETVLNVYFVVKMGRPGDEVEAEGAGFRPEKYGLDASVFVLQVATPRALAHEAGHYLNLDHVDVITDAEGKEVCKSPEEIATTCGHVMMTVCSAGVCPFNEDFPIPILRPEGNKLTLADVQRARQSIAAQICNINK